MTARSFALPDLREGRTLLGESPETIHGVEGEIGSMVEVVKAGSGVAWEHGVEKRTLGSRPHSQREE